MKIFNLALASLVPAGLASQCYDTNNGNGDSTGDGCNWYADGYYCDGTWDTEFFKVSQMCCGCGGGVTYDCEDTNEGNGDTGGDKCDWYNEHEGNCSGFYDTANFKVESMCCTCGGGNDLCYDSANAVGDTYGDGCSWYEGNEAWCGSYDHADFIASAVCCACQSAESSLNLATYSTCSHTSYGATDWGTDGCDWYTENSGQCGWWDDDDFDSFSMCCGCGGGLDECNDSEGAADNWGDGCSWYEGNESWCGQYDWDGFHAAEDCCTCQSAYAVNLSWSLVGASEVEVANGYDCTNTQLADNWGDGCSWYAANPGYCGDFDWSDFHANDDCCGCGGGSYCIDTTWNGDIGGDGCDWYAENPGYCGMFDTDYFDSKNDCCACKAPSALNLVETCYGSACPDHMDYSQGSCNDNAQGAVDIGGDGCDWYWNNQDSCGWWD
jgi:hypothetical protein